MITHDVYYIEWPETAPPAGVEVVEQVSSPAGAMVTVRGTFSQVATFVTWLYDECETDAIVDALPDDAPRCHCGTPARVDSDSGVCDAWPTCEKG